jgi:acetyl esterase
MPVTLDPDAAFVFKAFQEAGRPAYETLSPTEARDYYLQARLVTRPTGWRPAWCSFTAAAG